MLYFYRIILKISGQYYTTFCAKVKKKFEKIKNKFHVMLLDNRTYFMLK